VRVVDGPRSHEWCLNRNTLAGPPLSRVVLEHSRPAARATSIYGYVRNQKMNRSCNWNIRGGSMLANAGIAFVAVPTATN
jgi:hypothetical protein